MTPQSIRFVIVGAAGFLVQVGVVAALTMSARWPAAITTAIAVEAAVLFNFACHEAWTWRDRLNGSSGRLERLGRFQACNGIASLLGNVVIVSALVAAVRMHPAMANLVAVLTLSLVNYLAADRWIYRTPAALAVLVAILGASSSAGAAELTPQTVAAWNQHVALTEAALARHEHDAPLLVPEGRTIEAGDGAIHEWRGSITIPHTTVAHLLDAVTNPAAPTEQEDVAESRVLERRGDSQRVYLKLVRRVIVTVTYDTEHDVSYRRRTANFATSRSVATSIVETGGSDRGFLWRLNSYWRYRQVGDAVQVDVLSLSLSRDVPWVIQPIARPIIDRIGRESMSRTLNTVRRKVEAHSLQAALKSVRVDAR